MHDSHGNESNYRVRHADFALDLDFVMASRDHRHYSWQGSGLKGILNSPDSSLLQIGNIMNQMISSRRINKFNMHQ